MKNKMTINPKLKFRLIAFVVPALLLGLSFVCISLAKKNIVNYTQIKQENNIKLQAYQESANLNQFVESNATILSKLSYSFPSESMMVGVMQDIEAVIKQYDQTSSVKFSSQTPVKVGQNLVIPLVLNVNLEPQDITALIEELMELPYIIQPITIESQFNDGRAQTQISIRMYVQEPFIGN